MIDDVLLDAEERMTSSVEHTRDELVTIRTGRANPAMFNGVMADFYGARTPINQMATISVPEPRMLLIKPYDMSTMGEIENAIRNSDLGVNPTDDGQVIRVTVPQLTEERRKDLVKQAKQKGEDGKIAIRNIRRDANQQVKDLLKDKAVTEDDVRRSEDEGPNASRGTGVAGSLQLQAGDAVLVQGPWAALTRYTQSPDVIAVTPPQALQRAVPLGRGAKRALVVLGVMVVLLATGLVPAAVAGLLAAGALVLTRVLTIPQTYRSISWTTVILIAGMIPLSAAFIATGAADRVADLVLGIIGSTSPHLALLVLCVLTMVLGQFISNVATVLVVTPIAVAIAQTLELSIQPFMMALTVAGAAAFLTPVATPANLMVLQPGGYRFGDYWKLGLPLMVVYLAVAVLYVPLVWPF